MGMFLEPIEIKDLTHRTHRRAQVAVLNFLGIQHKVRADGSIAILRSHVKKEFGDTEGVKSSKPAEPNWEAMNA
jgi:hypothetical protein